MSARPAASAGCIRKAQESRRHLQTHGVHAGVTSRPSALCLSCEPGRGPRHEELWAPAPRLLPSLPAASHPVSLLQIRDASAEPTGNPPSIPIRRATLTDGGEGQNSTVRMSASSHILRFFPKRPLPDPLRVSLWSCFHAPSLSAHRPCSPPHMQTTLSPSFPPSSLLLVPRPSLSSLPTP